jgi:hypothetical protein
VSRRFRKRDTRPIPRLTPRKQRPFEQQITKSGHWLRCVNAHTWWGRFRTEDASWNGPEFRTEAGQKFRAACVARVRSIWGRKVFPMAIGHRRIQTGDDTSRNSWQTSCSR